jgi:hypothetical protein
MWKWIARTLIGVTCAVVLLAAWTLGPSYYARWTYSFLTLPEDSRILYEPGAEDLAQQARSVLTQSIERISAKHRTAFKAPADVRVYVFNDEQRYSRFSNSRPSRGSSHKSDVYLSPKVRRTGTLPGILKHELSHVQLQQHLGMRRFTADVPGWFAEGLAVYASEGAGAETVTPMQATAAMRGGSHFIPEDSGSTFSPPVAASYGLSNHMYYRQAALFVEYLVNESPAKFEQAMTALTAGERFRDVWLRYYDKRVDVLWMNYIESIQSP